MGESALGALVGSDSNVVMDEEDVAILTLLFDDEDEMEMMCQEVETHRSVRRGRSRPTDETTTIDSDDQVLRLEQSVSSVGRLRPRLTDRWVSTS